MPPTLFNAPSARAPLRFRRSDAPCGRRPGGMRAFVALGVALVLLVVAEGSTTAIPSSPVAAYGDPMTPVTVPTHG